MLLRDDNKLEKYSIIQKLPHLLAGLVLFGSYATALAASNETVNAKRAALDTARQLKVARESGSIEAELVADNDYYIRRDGKRIQYLRKRGVRIVKPQSDANRLINQQMKRGTVQEISQHKLGSRSVVRIVSNDNNANMAALLDKTQPVLANAKGQGDLEVIPFVTIKLKQGVEPESALKKLRQQFGLTMVRRLRVSGNVYSFAMQQMSDPAQAFQLVRDLYRSELVNWAEPQFNAKPIKHTITNEMTGNQLGSRQWHLRNTTQKGALCDVDCDADLAWYSHTGEDVVIAVIDDGVQLNHPDLQANIWVNTAELNGTVGVDDDGNGYIDDINGYDFVKDSNSCTGDTGYSGDGTVGVDNDPSPQAPSSCIDVNGDDFVEDDHGTAVAGIAAAVGNNSIGVTGMAYQAKILPIRAISGYDVDYLTQGSDFCTRIAEAMTYAGRHADVINNSWEMATNCMALEDVISDVVAGTIMDNSVNVSKRANKGSPVIFSAGNSASGWYKVTVDGIAAGEHEFEWRFTRGAFFDPFQTLQDVVWIDDIQWPDGAIEGFEGAGFDDFNTGCDINQCTLVASECALDTSSCDSIWELNNDSTRSRGGSGRSLKADLSTDNDAKCDYTYLTTKRTVSAGSLSFWIWVSADLSFDKVEFLVDGQEQSSFGDTPRFVQNDVSYPANLADTIAVGASTDGIFMDANNTPTDRSKEERVYYSQYGAALDLVAPSSNQHQGIVTTDRTGVNGYNLTDNLSCSPVNAGCDYVDYFGGTSAAAPMVSGAAALVLEADPTLTAAQVRAHLQNGAEQIGPYLYTAEKSDETGHGRLNVYHSVRLAMGDSSVTPIFESCNSPEAYVIDPVYAVLDKKDTVQNQCSSQVYEDDGLCFPIKAKNGNIAMVCL